MQKLPGRMELPPSRTETTDGSISVGIGVSKTINDPSTIEIVRTHLHLHHITHGDFYEVLSQFSGNMGKHLMPIFQFNTKHRTGQNRNNLTLYLNIFFGGHKIEQSIL